MVGILLVSRFKESRSLDFIGHEEVGGKTLELCKIER